MPATSIYDLMKEFIPNDHCRQSRASEMAKNIIAKKKPQMIVDLGCGAGNSVDFFRKCAPQARWVGVDIEQSPEVMQRIREDADFLSYNGVDLPFEDGSVDFIYSNQVLEHVRFPERLLRDVRRVLSSDGIFVGQTSQLEPYHSFSYWNFTVFGFTQICRDAGLRITELRPGIDARTLFERTYKGRPPEYSKWFSEESPLNQEIEYNAKLQSKRNSIINFRKLQNCGQFCFVCSAI
ncbi:MAG: class I SAM-dependent methyltransferase [Sphingobium sp.]